MKQSIIILVIFIFSLNVSGQVDFENKYSTFGIIAVDTVENTWGCAFATNNIAIGQSGVYEIVPEKGIIASIAFTNPEYPIKGIDLLKKGNTLKYVFDSISKTDKYSYYRQVAMIDSAGNTLGFTGNTIKSFSYAGTLKGYGYVVLGNSLSNDTVLQAIESVFINSSAPLYKRLLSALKAGQEAGGQLTGKMSASICVKKSGQTGFNETDYRVDFSETPFKDLQNLVDKKSGISMLRKANRTEDKDSALCLLDDAAVLLKDWTMLYPEISKSYYRNGYEEKAVDVLAKRLETDSLFIGFIPSCYFLNSNERYQDLISEKEFEKYDWLEAIYSLLEFKMNKEAIEVSSRLIERYKECSYLHFFLGKAYGNMKEYEKAIESYQAALKLDSENIEARNELGKLNNNNR
jgi:uncharacterized Ntn-hydrolase superfamily protein